MQCPSFPETDREGEWQADRQAKRNMQTEEGRIDRQIDIKQEESRQIDRRKKNKINKQQRIENKTTKSKPESIFRENKIQTDGQTDNSRTDKQDSGTQNNNHKH